jgi:small subunit ribosomal protein S6
VWGSKQTKKLGELALTSYELMLLIDPGLGEEKTEALLTKVANKIKTLGGEIEKTDKWGTKKLASIVHRAKKLTSAYYVVIYFKSATSLPAELRNFLKVTEEVVRSSIMHAVEKTLEPAVEAVNVGEIKEVAGELGGES